jgi:hypothetical protein
LRHAVRTSSSVDLDQHQAMASCGARLEAMTHMQRDTWLFVLSLIWLVVLLVAIPFVLGIW